MNKEEIQNKIIAEITPDNNSFSQEINTTVKKIENTIKNLSIDAVLKIGGSFAKNTNLVNDFDIDVFIRFSPYKYSNEISNLLEKILNKAIGKETNIIRIHGSRDYFQCTLNTFHYELIPVLFIEKPEDAQNVTDMSPLHVDWVKNHTSKDKNLCNEIRLTKQFCKANEIYGAESFIKGISGHVLDILTIYYGSFNAFLRAVKKWTDKTIIDPQKHYNSPEEIITVLNEAKIYSPLIVIDPIQFKRNAAAAISKEKYNLLIETVKAYEEDPKESYFIRKIFSLEETQKKLENEFPREQFIAYSIKPLEGNIDRAGCKILKIFNYIATQSKIKGFSLLEKGWSFNKKDQAYIYYIFKNETLSKFETLMGPPIKVKENATQFVEKHKQNKDAKIIEEEGRYYVSKPRKYRKIKNLLNEIINEKYIQDKVTFISEVK